jgi:amino acid permease
MSEVEEPLNSEIDQPPLEAREDDLTLSSNGSSIAGVVFNFTNSIIGAGIIGLGGAIASSGGLISIIAILLFAFLTKLSLDLVIEMSIGSSYEDLGRRCYGTLGWSGVLISKMMYSFGCLVAYIVVVKDNCGSALGHLISVDVDDTLLTLSLCTFVMLPLCLLRDMTPLSILSLGSVASMGVILGIVVGIFFYNPNDIREMGGTVVDHWFLVKPGLLESLGTFVFSFVSQHTVHLSFESLKPELKTLDSWKSISSWSMGIASFVSLNVGIIVYMTFWDRTGSDLFLLYPALPIIDVAKLLLCITMVLTFPFPFFTCRDMIIVAAVYLVSGSENGNDLQHDERLMEEPLLLSSQDEPNEASETSSPEQLPSWLLSSRQLIASLHVFVSVLIWGITITLAFVAPNLGDVLNLVGCATGTVLAFILPALFSFKIHGYNHKAMSLLLVGGLVGSLGTFFSTRKLLSDTLLDP